MNFLKKLLFLSIAVAFEASANISNYANVDGPNCLNSALVKTGIAKSQRYASNGEMWAALNSPLCRRLENNEPKQENDIGIILENGKFSDKNIISHAFIQVDAQLVYEKRGYSKSEPYQTVQLQNVLAEYHINANTACQQNHFDRLACSAGTDYYRCQNLEQFIDTNKSQIKRFTISAFRELEQVEFNLQQYMQNISFPENKNKYLQIERELQLVSSHMVDMPDSVTTEDNLIKKIIANRFVSISGQLNAIQHPELRNLIWPWENQDKNIEKIFEIILPLKIQDDLDLLYVKVREKYLSVYSPIIKSVRNVDLKVAIDEDYRSTAGSVSLFKNEANIALGIDLHRAKKMVPDAYTAILCHETGHLLGGQPYSGNTLKPSADWASNIPSSSEGQSDYFSSFTCMKKVFTLDTPSAPVNYAVSTRVKNLCLSTYKTVLEQNICQRSAKAGFDLMTYILSIYQSFAPNPGSMKIDMDTPEKAGLSVGNLYPSFQCRLDTILAGALNQKRPSCWYVE